ncbi:hypothetical protein SynMITS9220_01188 [Synechococcus sp. MIT S9220]|nr:hypothetical protein SynMITS9220_01188 [Synechococcus sp. MIT S9220]
MPGLRSSRSSLAASFVLLSTISIDVRSLQHILTMAKSLAKQQVPADQILISAPFD